MAVVGHGHSAGGAAAWSHLCGVPCVGDNRHRGVYHSVESHNRRGLTASPVDSGSKSDGHLVGAAGVGLNAERTAERLCGARVERCEVVCAVGNGHEVVVRGKRNAYVVGRLGSHVLKGESVGGRLADVERNVLGQAVGHHVWTGGHYDAHRCESSLVLLCRGHNLVGSHRKVAGQGERRYTRSVGKSGCYKVVFAAACGHGYVSVRHSCHLKRCGAGGDSRCHTDSHIVWGGEPGGD